MASSRPPRGRDDLVADVLALLAEGGPRLITLTGLPGVGKTTVAHHVATLLASTPTARSILPPGGQVYVVGDWMASSGRELSVTLAAALALAPTDSEDDDQLLAALDAVPRVIVVDDPPTDASTTSAIGALIESCPRLRLVLTRHAPTRLPGEHIVRVEPLSVPRDLATLTELGGGAAIEIFRDVARAAGGHLRGSPDELSDIAAICRLVGGLPLGIALAGARTVAFSPGEIRRSIESAPQLDEVFAAGQAGAGASRAITWTIGLVSPPVRTLLADLMVFRSPVSADVIDQVCGPASPNVVDGLTVLADLHLVEVDRVDGDRSRFHLHPMVRAHLAQTLPPDDRSVDIRRRHAEWAVQFARRSSLRHLDEGRVDVLADIGSVADELLGVLDRAAEDRDSDAFATVSLALAPWWFHRVQHSVATEVLERALRLSDHVPRALAAQLLAWSAAFRADRAGAAADHSLAREEMSRALALAESCDDEVHLAVLERAAQTGWVFEEADGVTPVSEWCERGRRLAAGLGAAHSLTRLETVAAVCARQAGDYVEAERWGTRALARARRLDDPALLVISAGLLSTLPGPPSVELPPGPELVSLARSTGDRRTLAWIEPTVAWRALRTGDVATAAGLCTDQLQRSLEAGAWSWCDAAVLTLTRVAVAHGSPTLAARLHGVVEPRMEHIRRTSPRSVVEGHLRRVEGVAAALGSQRFDRILGVMAELDHRDALVQVLEDARSLVAALAVGAELVDVVSDPLESLTPREIEVLRLLVSGESNKGIASTLSISPKTVMHHTSSIYRKLEVSGRAEAAAVAARYLLDDGTGP